MRTFGIIALCIMLLIGAGAAWWTSLTPTYVHRFRLAIEVDVDGEIRIGSSVIEVRTTDYKAGSGETGGLRSQVFGDAIFLDLGNGRNVVALLGFDPNGSRNAIDLLDFHAFRATIPTLRIEDLPSLSGSVSLSGELVPTLVTFSDVNRPETARVVRASDFEQVFGPTVHFKRAWIEMTRDPVTRGIEKGLPWWNGPGRPAATAYRAWRKGSTGGPAIEPETLFKRG